jgi:thioredoxin-dependent peroxiredoxin
MKQIKIGEIIPGFSLPDQDGNLFDISKYIGMKKLVIFFYPQDGSHGCTREACYFRDLSELFDKADAIIVGISGQSVDSHKKFAEDYRLNFPILSDTDNKVRKLFGVPSGLFGMLPGRITFIADRDGRVVHIFNSTIQAERHVDEALRMVLLLKKSDNVN